MTTGLLTTAVGSFGTPPYLAKARAAYAAGVTWGLLKLIDIVWGLRVSADEERRGLDTTQHGEPAYQGV